MAERERMVKKKRTQVETDVNTTTRETKEQMGRRHKKGHKETEKYWISCTQDRNKWKSYSEKTKTFKD